MNLRPAFAEFLGTFFLVFGGTAAALGVAIGGVEPGGVVVPLAFGLTLVVGIFALGHISGAHFNPAVTLAFVVGKHFKVADAVPYLIAQLLGATAASAVLFLAFGDGAGFTTSPTMPSPVAMGADPVLTTLLFEFLATFFLMLVITAVATDTRIEGVPAGLAIGFTVAAMALGTGWVGGGSFNPARSFGPALVGGEWAYHWLYWVGPIAGAIAGVLTYNAVRGPMPEREPAPVMRDTTRS